MAIKHVGEIVDAWVRGYEIICNACKCRDVHAKLKYDVGYQNSLGESLHRIICHYPGTVSCLVYYDGRRWNANIIAGDSVEDFLASITIVKPIDWSGFDILSRQLSNCRCASVEVI